MNSLVFFAVVCLALGLLVLVDSNAQGDYSILPLSLIGSNTRSFTYTSDLVYFKTRVLHERHKYDTSATQATRVRHEFYTNDTSATRVKNFNFDNDPSDNIFSHPYISYMANKRLQGEEQFHSKNYLLQMPHSHAKMRNGKSYIKKLLCTRL